MQGYFIDVRKYICKYQTSDSFAKYFAKLFNFKYNQPRYHKVQELCMFKILCRNNILNVM